jgi:hypothetical protein
MRIMNIYVDEEMRYAMALYPEAVSRAPIRPKSE